MAQKWEFLQTDYSWPWTENFRVIVKKIASWWQSPIFVFLNELDNNEENKKDNEEKKKDNEEKKKDNKNKNLDWNHTKIQHVCVCACVCFFFKIYTDTDKYGTLYC